MTNGDIVMALLSGTGRLADDLYLLAHDDVTGRAFLQPRALGLGLAGGLLAELVVTDSIRVWAGGIEIVSRAAPGDGLARRVLGLALTEPQQHPLQEWLTFLAASAGQNVADRLGESGYLTRVSSRRPWRDGRWVPVDPDCAFAPLIRVRAALDPARPVTATDTALAGLAAACGLGSRLLPYGPPDGRRCLEGAVRQLSPSLRELIAQTQAAVDSALLSHRV
jgi:Golgi phosphoprotein 3 (GPP34)